MLATKIYFSKILFGESLDRLFNSFESRIALLKFFVIIKLQ